MAAHSVMAEQSKAIFREEVFRRFARARREPVWPRWVAPNSRRVLWSLLALTFAAGVLAWRTPVPLFVSSSAISVRANDTCELALLVPIARASSLRVGQNVYAESGGVEGSIVAVDAQPSAPADVITRFSLTGAAAAAVGEPVIVATVTLDEASNAARASSFAGTVSTVRVRVGQRSALSYVPLVGALFGGER